jgi:hypothetical protein
MGDENEGDDGTGVTSWYVLPPAAPFFAAGVLGAFLPKDALFAGDYTHPTAVALLVSNLVIFAVFVAFVLVVRRVGLTPAVQWMVSPGFGVEE